VLELLPSPRAGRKARAIEPTSMIASVRVEQTIAVRPTPIHISKQSGSPRQKKIPCLSHSSLSLAAFITNIAESDFQYTQNSRPKKAGCPLTGYLFA
jgi:hypothetical protein